MEAHGRVNVGSKPGNGRSGSTLYDRIADCCTTGTGQLRTFTVTGLNDYFILGAVIHIKKVIDSDRVALILV